MESALVGRAQAMQLVLLGRASKPLTSTADELDEADELTDDELLPEEALLEVEADAELLTPPLPPPPQALNTSATDNIAHGKTIRRVIVVFMTGGSAFMRSHHASWVSVVSPLDI